MIDIWEVGKSSGFQGLNGNYLRVFEGTWNSKRRLRHLKTYQQHPYNLLQLFPISSSPFLRIYLFSYLPLYLCVFYLVSIHFEYSVPVYKPMYNEFLIFNRSIILFTTYNMHNYFEIFLMILRSPPNTHDSYIFLNFVLKYSTFHLPLNHRCDI